jgi:hypothetical protein
MYWVFVGYGHFIREVKSIPWFKHKNNSLLLWILKVHRCHYRNTSLDPILSHLNPIHILTCYACLFLLMTLSNQHFTCISHSPTPSTVPTSSDLYFQFASQDGISVLYCLINCAGVGLCLAQPFSLSRQYCKISHNHFLPNSLCQIQPPTCQHDRLHALGATPIGAALGYSFAVQIRPAFIVTWSSSDRDQIGALSRLFGKTWNKIMCCYAGRLHNLMSYCHKEQCLS